MINSKVLENQTITCTNGDTVAIGLSLKSYGESQAQMGNGTGMTFGVGGNYNTNRVGAQIHTIKVNYDIDCDLVFSNRTGGIVTESGRFSAGGYFSAKSLTGVGNRAVYSDVNGYLTNTSSDERVKKNITKITDTIDVILSLKQLNGIKYNWNTEIKGYERMGEQTEIGVIAQEVEKVLPEIVGENNTGYKSVDYAKLTAFLIEVNKEQQKQIEDLQNRISKLEV